MEPDRRRTARSPRAEELIDEAADSPARAIQGADLIVLAAPPLAALDLIDALAGPLIVELAPDALVTDVASTKGAIVARAEAAGLRFVGGHPMAGREVGGFDAATAGPVRRPTVGHRPGLDRADTATGNGSRRSPRPAARARCAMTAGDHDTAVAAISHLPLVVAAALVESGGRRRGRGGRPDWPTAASLAATGWRDMTRLARGDVAMGAGIAATNAPAIAARLRDLQAVLDAWLADLDGPTGPDAERIRARFDEARNLLLASDAEAAE